MSCLRLTTPALQLAYPLDAEAHYEEIRQRLAPWRQDRPGFRPHGAAGYGGPWLENEWISGFERQWAAAKARGQPLQSVFGPWIPLLIPWTSLWVNNKYGYPRALLVALRAVLRPSVPYITLCQNDEGLEGRGELPMRSIPNVCVLSSGGYGHVPVPLLKQQEPLLAAPEMSQRPLLVSYVGSLGNAPAALRTRMRDAVNASAGSGFRYAITHGLSAKFSALPMPRIMERLISRIAGVESWRDVMSHSKLSLCPRGFGRSSYHLAETVQMGRVPVYVYDGADDYWVPYEKLFRRSLGYVTDVVSLGALLTQLHAAPDANEGLARRERFAEKVRDSHFSMRGVVAQIGRFLTAPRHADLLCRPLPRTRCGGCMG